MNCAHVRTLWTDWLYGELSADQEERLREHLADCDECRQAAQELRRSFQLLGSVPRTETRVDLGRLYRRAAARSQRSRRRWRRGALVACAATLLVSVVALGRLRIECHADSLMLSWGDSALEPDGVRPSPAGDLPSPAAVRREPDVPNDSRAPTPSPADPWPVLKRHEERLATLDELAQLLVAEMDSTDYRRRLDFAALGRRLTDLERQNASRWAVLDRDVRAVYQLAQNQPMNNEKGAQP